MRQMLFLAALAVAALPSAGSAQTTNPNPPVNSAPGVQGPPDTRTGPATRAPGGMAPPTAQGGSTQPSQDASGVKGAPGNKNGPAVKAPGGGAPAPMPK